MYAGWVGEDVPVRLFPVAAGRIGGSCVVWAYLVDFGVWILPPLIPENFIALGRVNCPYTGGGLLVGGFGRGEYISNVLTW